MPTVHFVAVIDKVIIDKNGDEVDYIAYLKDKYSANSPPILFDTAHEAEDDFLDNIPSLKNKQALLLSATCDNKNTMKNFKLTQVCTLHTEHEEIEEEKKAIVNFWEVSSQRKKNPPNDSTDPVYIYDNCMVMSEEALISKSDLLIEYAKENLDFTKKLLTSSTISPVLTEEQLELLYNHFQGNKEFNSFVFAAPSPLPEKIADLFNTLREKGDNALEIHMGSRSFGL